MTTAYTAQVEDGKITSLRDFALLCARDIDYLYSLRDLPWGHPLPEVIHPSERSIQQLMALADEEGRLRAMTLTECRRAEETEYEEVVLFRAQQTDLQRTQHDRLSAMMEQVVAWQAPPPHESLKRFMIAQLSYDLQFAPYPYPPIERQPPEEWREQKLAKLHRDIDDAKEQLEHDRRQATKATTWLRALRDSLP